MSAVTLMTFCCLSVAGVRAIAAQEEPIRRVLSRMEVADGLTLDKVICSPVDNNQPCRLRWHAVYTCSTLMWIEYTECNIVVMLRDHWKS